MSIIALGLHSSISEIFMYHKTRSYKHHKACGIYVLPLSVSLVASITIGAEMLREKTI